MNDQDSTNQTAEDASPVSAPSTEGNAPPPALPSVPPPRGRKGLWFTLLLTFCVAAAAAAATGLVWLQNQQLESALAQADNAAALAQDAVRNAIESVEGGIDALQRSDAAILEASERVGSSVEELSIRYQALQSRVDDFQGVSGDPRRRWLLAEAEHYLTVGNAELSLAGRWETAITALQLADEALRQVAEPAYAPVRRQISADLQALLSAELVDVEGLSYTLGRLAGRVEELPMGLAAPGNFIAAPQRLEDAPSGWNRVWLSLKGALSGMISIERSEETDAAALTAGEQTLIRRQLELQLEMARLGLLRNQGQVFHGGLEAATTLLGRHFDGSEAAVQSALALLDEMAELDIEPQRPDISGSLSLLRELVARDD